MSSVRAVEYSSAVTYPVDALILRLVASVSGVDCQSVANVISTTTTSVIQTVSNTFTGTSSTQSAVGLTGSVKLLASTELLQSSVSASSAAVAESWMCAAEQTLRPIIVRKQRGGGQDTAAPLLQEAVHSFLASLEKHLFANDQTVLVGDSLTAADIVVAVLAAEAAAATESKVVVPQQTYRWMQLTLHALMKAVPAEAAALAVYADAIAEGTISPLEKAVAAAFDITTAAETTTKAAPAALSKSEKFAAKKAAQAAKAAAPEVPVATAETTTSTETTTTSTETTTTSTETTTTSTTTPQATVVDAGDNPILKLLNDFSISYEAYEHVPCMTADDLVTGVPLADPATETHTKNLFLRDKKHGLFLVTLSTASTVNTKDLGQKLKLAGKTNLRMADEAVLDKCLHVKPGTVGPLCIGLADLKGEEKITLVLDQSLFTSNYHTIHSHPARNDMSVKLTPEALKEYFQKLGVEPVLIEFAAAGDTAGKAPASRPPKTAAATATGTTAVAKQQQPQKKERDKSDKKTGKKGETLLALQWKKEENFSQWYTDVITLSEMISYYDISGCYILRPWSYKMWELIQGWFNIQIAEMEVENAYFPLFVSQERLEKEKDHVEGFAAEVAWVTKSGDGDLARPIAIRPTSETIMYPAFSDWIKSHRDLPLKLNQWSNVVRWEFKYPTPFLRTREFLWQEGHTAHSTLDEADETVMQALELYRRVYEDLLAVPVIPGYKTEKEKFAGGFRTTTVEAYIAGSGRAIQGATSHNLGQNFGKMFDIKFQDEKGESQIAWQTSWGLTTRTIGVMVMVHGDDTGLVLPPAVAPLQVVIVPIVSKNLSPEQADPYCLSILAALKSEGIRAKYDDRLIYNPGWKYNHWEQKGVPIRIEVGPRDIEQKCARIVIRHNGDKEDHPVEGMGELIKNKLAEIQSTMFTKALAARDSHMVQITEWKDFVPNLEKNNLVLTPWIGGEHQEWEEWVKTKSREESLGLEEEDEQSATSVAAKSLCIPFKQPELPAGTKCIASGEPATCWVLWGRSY